MWTGRLAGRQESSAINPLVLSQPSDGVKVFTVWLICFISLCDIYLLFVSSYKEAEVYNDRTNYSIKPTISTSELKFNQNCTDVIKKKKTEESQCDL